MIQLSLQKQQQQQQQSNRWKKKIQVLNILQKNFKKHRKSSTKSEQNWRTLVASRTVDNLCAITITVRPTMALSMASCTKCSLSASKALVAWSKDSKDYQNLLDNPAEKNILKVNKNSGTMNGLCSNSSIKILSLFPTINKFIEWCWTHTVLHSQSQQWK